MAKSATAFRTIREVADWLDVAAHVLRFWESKFNQIKPVKRAGGRRYYRLADMELVGGIKVLLHDRGLTIRGVQKLIADEGVEAVTSLSPPIDELIRDAGPATDMADANVVEGETSDDWADDTANEMEAPTLAPGAETETSTDDAPPDALPAPEPDTDTPTHDPQTAEPPRANPAEGTLGSLAALSQLPARRRAMLAPHITALARLRDRMAAPPPHH